MDITTSIIGNCNDLSRKLCCLLMLLWSFVVSCDHYRYYSIRANDSKWRTVDERDHEKVIHDFEGIRIEITSSTLVPGPKRATKDQVKLTRGLDFGVKIISSHSILFDGSLAFIVDRKGRKMTVSSSQSLDSDNEYPPDKRHAIFLSFYPDHGEIELPAQLHLPPFIADRRDTLDVPVFEVF